MKKFLTLGNLALALVFLNGCSSSAPPPPPLPTATISASPTTITVGQSATLTWSSTNATSCTASGAWSGSPAVSGTQSVTPTTAGTDTYTLSCTGSGGSITASAMLTVNAPPPTVTISLGLTTINLGQGTTLTWSSTNATSCTASGAWSGSQPVSGTQSVTPTAAGTDTYTLTCTGSGGTTQPASATLTVNAPMLSIVSVSNSSPMALTPLYITTSGLDTTQPVSIQLSNNSGYSTVLTAMRVQASGVISVAVPLYINPATGKTDSLSVSLTISQGTLTSTAVPLSIQDIPALSVYGTSLGTISRAFFNYQEIALGRMLNSLQAIQALPQTPSTVNTMTAQQHLSAQLMNMIEARNNIDQVVTNNSTAISVGTLSDGTQVNFDSNSVEIMDRVLGMYLNLLQTAVNATPAEKRHSKHSKSETTDGPAKRPKPEAIDLSSILKGIGVFSSGETVGAATRTFFNEDSNGWDEVIAVGQGLSAAVAIGGTVLAGTTAIAAAPAIVAGATVAGIAFGLAAVCNDYYHIVTDTSKIADLTASGSDPAALAKAEIDLTASQANIGLDALGTLLAPLTLEAAGAKAIGFGDGVFQLLEEVGADSVQSLVQGAAVIDTSLALYVQNEAIADTEAVTDAIAQFTAPFPSPSEGFGEIEGTADISNSEGPILSGLTGISIDDPSGTDFTTLDDLSGDYDVIVPLGSTTLDYSAMTINAVDPVSQDDLSTVNLNLSSLTSAAPLMGPTLTGVCNDTDADDPDSDDPDCD